VRAQIKQLPSGIPDGMTGNEVSSADGGPLEDHHEGPNAQTGAPRPPWANVVIVLLGLLLLVGSLILAALVLPRLWRKVGPRVIAAVAAAAALLRWLKPRAWAELLDFVMNAWALLDRFWADQR
jgi:hypothetical protein